jgi:ferredoxin-nitrite reductase
VRFEPGQVFLEPEEVWTMGDAVIVDVRDESTYQSMEHVPGAVNIPYEKIRDPSSVTAGHMPKPEDFASLLGAAGISPEDTVVAYDDDRGVYAARFLLTAAVFGHTGNLHLLNGDYTVWQREFPTVTASSSVEPTTYETAPPDDPPIVERSGVESVLDDADSILLDTRTPAEFDQSHIPGAIQLGWEDLVREDGRQLKDVEVIEELLADRGITRGKEIFLYCNTARRLSHTFAVLRELGYDDVRFYEGSLTDWIRSSSPEWDPTALRDRVRSVADGGFERLVGELSEDVLNRLKLIGLYHQKQEGYFMLRTKVPGGVLTAKQARVIGNVADEFAHAPAEYGGSEQNPVFGDRFLDVTDRQDVQMHWIRIDDIPEIWDRYESVGLTTLQACGNSVRNVVGCPAAGFDANETIDGQPIVEAITDRFAGDTKYANLPRKLKVSVTGCHENCARAHINDLGFTPAVKDGRDGFNVRIGGGLSDGPRMASELDVFVEPEEVVSLVKATADVFLEYGSYLDTAVNRLRFLVEELGVDAIRDELARRVNFPLRPSGESLTKTYRGDHVGVHEQEDGRRYVGLNVPTGRMLGSEFAELADLAEDHGRNEVRLTLNQNVLLPHIPETAVAELRSEPLCSRYSPDPGPFRRGILTCTGREFCSYGIVETKTRALRWARHLDEWAATHLDDPPEVVRVHLSGCSAACAQPQIADIGLRGETYRDADGEHEGLDVGLGGDLGRETFVDWFATGEPINVIPERIQGLLLAYNDEGTGDFADWVNETADRRLHELVASSTGSGGTGPSAAPMEGD